MGYCKYITKYFFPLVLFFQLSLQLPAFTGKYPIQNFTPTDYKAGIQNIDFVQNRDMNLFVANNLGVLSYNGNEWEVRASEPGKKERSLAFDENTNRLYVGSQGNFGYFDEEWSYTSLKEDIPESAQDFDEVWDVFLLNSNVYFCTFQGIYVYDGQSISVIGLEGGLNRSFFANGRLFTQNQQGKLFEIQGTDLESVYPQIQQGQIIAGVIQADDGYLLIYNSGEIEHTTSFGVSRKHEGLISALKGKYVNHVLQLSDTRLAVVTQTAGLFLYDLQNRSIENITTQDGLLTNACLRVFQDYSGNLWVGMQNGIALIDINSPMRFINRKIKLQGSGYESFDADEGTYFTTSNGIYFLAKNATQSSFLPGTEGPAYGIQQINGKLYVGHHTGLFLLKKGTAKRLASTNGLWQIKQLRSQPAFAIGGTYSGLYLFQLDEQMELRPVQKIDGFNESSRFFEEDSNGEIWVGQFYKGLYRLKLSAELTSASATKVSEADGLPATVQIVLSRIDNELFLSTEAGIYKVDQTSGKIVKAETFAKDIGEQQIYLLVQDHQKNIHVYGENVVGFFKQISSKNYIFVPSSLFQLRYSLNNDLLNVSINTKHGILFNANEGFIHYQPELENRVTVQKPLVVSKIYSATQDIVLYALPPFAEKPEKNGNLTISYGIKVLQFNIESFQFNKANNQQYRYFLKGFDEGYGDWTNTTIKEYTNLKEGTYEFMVQTRNNLGKIITSQPFLLNIKPPFYRSQLAKSLYVILGILLFLLVSKRQKRKYARKTKEVEKAKEVELAKKEEELIKIERQKKKEIQQMEEDKMKSELQHLNNLLAASTMNLVVKNEFIETIKEKIKEVTRKGKNKETKQALEQIVKEIDVTLKLQEDWEQFEHHFDQVHGSFLTRLRTHYSDLSPNEQKLCAFLRLNLNTKDIANLMGISLRGVEVARYRLRKKLNLNKGQNLSKFILDY
ncbi:MAG: triple tyrosine motif-containing protein [Bacteroidota bacterium]